MVSEFCCVTGPFLSPPPAKSHSSIVYPECTDGGSLKLYTEFLQRQSLMRLCPLYMFFNGVVLTHTEILLLTLTWKPMRFHVEDHKSWFYCWLTYCWVQLWIGTGREWQGSTLLHTREEPGWNLDHYTGYYDWDIPWFFSVCPGNYQGIISTYAANSSWYIVSTSPAIYHPIIREVPRPLLSNADLSTECNSTPPHPHTAFGLPTSSFIYFTLSGYVTNK